jgi:holo-[acyl-carrier protein] synthase
MILGVGIDLVEIERFKSALRRHGDRLLEKVFTPEEREYCESRMNRIAHYTARFAGKEAVLKALGTGWSGGIAWTDVNIVHVKSGNAEVSLSGVALKVAEEKGVRNILISISHSQLYANAVAIAEG